MAATHTYKDYDGNLITKKLSPVKAIRKFCLVCLGGSTDEIKNCTDTTCCLFPFRFGKDPGRKPMSDERREIMAERMKALFVESKQEPETSL
jgi:hypothetical protein